MYFKNIILGILGAVLTMLLGEVVLPDGEIKKYIKVVFSMCVALMIAVPSLDFGLLASEFSTGTFVLNREYVDNFNKSVASLYEDYLDKVLIENGVTAKIEASIKDNLCDGVIITVSSFGKMSREKLIDLAVKTLAIDKSKVILFEKGVV